MFERFTNLFRSHDTRRSAIEIEQEAILRHVRGATVVHAGPFSNLEVPIASQHAVKHLYPQFVAPFYMKRMRTFDATTDDAFIQVREKITDGLITQLLSDFNWRSRTAAAYFTVILTRPVHIEHLGRLLLRSDVCYAGRAYCVAMAYFRTAAAVDFLDQYLAHYLNRPDLHFDQWAALSALKYVDEMEGSSHVLKHTEAIAAMNARNPALINKASAEFVTDELRAAERIRNL